MAELHFLRPEWFLLLVPAALVLGYLRWRAHRAEVEAGQGVIAEHLAVHFRADSHSRKNYLPIYAAGLIAILLSVTLAQPVWKKVSVDGHETAPLLIVFDASQSMLKHDVSPSRNARAHLQINRLLSSGLHRPVGILAVAGSAHILLPPALDTDIVKLYLSYLDPGVMPVDGGDLSNLVDLLQENPALMPGGTTVLLVTDGMNSGAERLKSFLDEHGLPLATLAFTDLGTQTARQLGGSVIQGDKLAPGDDRLDKAVRKLLASGAGAGAEWRDEYRWFIVPVCLFLLYWFRRGVTLYWAPVALLMVVTCFPTPVRAGPVDWFFSPDQQGMLLLKFGKYKAAAARFDDPAWKAVACYYAEDWKCARRYFRAWPSEAGVYNMATSAAQGGSYKLSRDLYAQLLKIDPDYPHARANHDQVAKIVQDIDRLSKSQAEARPPPSDSVKKSAEYDPQDIADGAKQRATGVVKRQTLSASDVLKSEATTQRWLRDISRNPKDFIRARFQYEYAARQANKADE